MLIIGFFNEEIFSKEGSKFHAKKKLVIIGDPVSSLNISSDSSLALAQAALQENFEVYWCSSQSIHLIGAQIYLSDLSIFHNISVEKIDYVSCPQKIVPFKSFDNCFIRKDPPFDESYKNLCWLLNTENEVSILNSPGALLSFHEKAIQWRAFAEGYITEEQVVPTCLSPSLEVIEEFCIANEKSFSKGFICKPWTGHGGESVEYFPTTTLLLNSLKLKSGNLNNVMVQPFLEEIHTQGDRRVLIASGKVVCDFVRIPAEGKIASNLAQGGTPVLREMSNEQKTICSKIAKFLYEKNIFFAGLDLIGTRIGEINITSPTGLRTYEALTGNNVAHIAFKLLIS